MNRPARAATHITVTAAVEGKLTLDDVRMEPAILLYQADQAHSSGNPQLADNLRRAAELATLEDQRVLDLYEALRPGRSTALQLGALVAELQRDGAPRCASLVAAALDTYRRRGLLR